MNTQDDPISLSFAAEPVQGQGGPLSKNEVERTRRYFAARFTQHSAGTITDVAWTLVAREDGTGNFEVTFTETVKQHLVSGRSSIALVDENKVVVASWDTPFWRACGTHVRTFAQAVPATISIQTLTPQFEIDGNARKC